MDVRKLLKVYNYVNDERRAKVNVKFIGVLAAFLLSGAALIGFFALQSTSPEQAPASHASKTDYVGLSQSEIAALPPSSAPALAEQRLDEWKAAHSGVVIEKLERVEVAGYLVAYRVTYETP